MKLRYLYYSLFALLLASSVLPFVYNRILASYKTAFLFNKGELIAQYTNNDRYDQVSKIIQQYPGVPLYFLASSVRPNDVSTSWQKIQTVYLAYPKNLTMLTHSAQKSTLIKLRNLEETAVVITPFKQNEFTEIATELHPHNEYYIYIFTKK